MFTGVRELPPSFLTSAHTFCRQEEETVPPPLICKTQAYDYFSTLNTILTSLTIIKLEPEVSKDKGTKTVTIYEVTEVAGNITQYQMLVFWQPVNILLCMYICVYILIGRDTASRVCTWRPEFNLRCSPSGSRHLVFGDCLLNLHEVQRVN